MLATRTLSVQLTGIAAVVFSVSVVWVWWVSPPDHTLADPRILRIALVTILVICTLGLLAWLRADYATDIRSILPLLGGREVGLYDFAGLALVVYGLWALTRFSSARRDQE